MAVFVVVPAEEDLAVAAGGLDRVEPVWEVGPVLQRLELCFAERVVVADVWAAVRLGDAEVGEQERHRLGGHRGARSEERRVGKECRSGWVPDLWKEIW